MTSAMQVLIAVDQLANAMIGGMADETVSSRAFRGYVAGKRRWCIAYRVINAVFFWQVDHCFKAYRSEIERRQMPREFQT